MCVGTTCRLFHIIVDSDKTASQILSQMNTEASGRGDLSAFEQTTVLSSPTLHLQSEWGNIEGRGHGGRHDGIGGWSSRHEGTSRQV